MHHFLQKSNLFHVPGVTAQLLPYLTPSHILTLLDFIQNVVPTPMTFKSESRPIRKILVIDLFIICIFAKISSKKPEQCNVYY